MSPGGKDGGKHWTKAEIEARQEADELLHSEKPQRMRVPSWLSPEAKKIWKQTLDKFKGIELLEKVDEDILAIYCDATAKYREMADHVNYQSDDKDIKSLQSWARVVSTYAEKLGFTPASRARLAKKKADDIIDRFGDKFD